MGEKKLAEKRAGKGFSDLIARLTALADSSDRISVHEIRQEIGERSFGPILIIPAVIEISPTGGIPGVPTAIAIIISLFAVQILAGANIYGSPDLGAANPRRTEAEERVGEAVDHFTLLRENFPTAYEAAHSVTLPAVSGCGGDVALCLRSAFGAYSLCEHRTDARSHNGGSGFAHA